MGEKEARSLLEKRLYLELQIFRYSVLRKSKREIYDCAYKIEVLETIYDLLLENIQNIKEEILYHLLWWNGGILELTYQEWLKKEDSSYEELSEHIRGELTLFSEDNHEILIREESNGERIDQAA